MRSAGCAYNDIVDRDLDAQVERTRLRPLASGRVSVARGVGAGRRLCRCSASVVLLRLAARRAADRAGEPRPGRGLPVHEAHHLVAAGVARAGLFVGRAGRLAGGDRARSRCPPLLLWLGSIFWVIGYDTLYAIQDIEDDALVGVKSSARALGGRAQLGVGICYALALIGWGAAIWAVAAAAPRAARLAPRRASPGAAGCAHRPRRWRGGAGPVPLESLHRPAAVSRLPCRRLVVGA